MKQFFILLLFQVFAISFCDAQQSLQDSLITLKKQNDSISLQLRTLLTRVDENSYIRIPRSEFDESVVNRVDRLVGEKFDGLRNLVFFLLAILGGGLLLALKSMISNNIKDHLDKERTALEKKLDTEIEKNEHRLEKKIEDKSNDLEERQHYFEQGLDKNIEYIYLTTVKEKTEKEMQELKNIYESKIREVEEKISAFDSKIRLSTKNSIEYELYKLSNTRSYTAKDFEKLKAYLPEARQLQDTSLLSDMINELSKAAYYTKREAEMGPILDEFMGLPGIEIKENAFINIASGMFYNYALSHDKATKDKAFSYIDRSLAKLPDYGEALGLKLEYYMVDYQYATGAEKEQVLQDAATLLKQVSMSDFAVKETLGRFDRVKTNPTEKKYIELLYKLFPEVIHEIELMRNPAVPMTETVNKDELRSN